MPGFLPQHEGENKGEFVITGNRNPLPTAGYVMTEGGMWVPQRGSDDGAAHTQVTGSIVEDIVVDSEAILDSESHFYNAKGGDYKKIFIYLTSSLDVELTVGLRPFPKSLFDTKIWSGSDWDTLNRAMIPAGTNEEYNLNSFFEWINDTPFAKMSGFSVRLQASEVPSEGSVSVKLIGVRA